MPIMTYHDFVYYCSINRDLPVGAAAPNAHQNIRKFPDWYKPYTFNYTGEGYFVVALLGGACRKNNNTLLNFMPINSYILLLQ